MHLTAKANLYLLLATIIWGLTFPLLRSALTNIDPSLFVAIRFLLAAIILLSFVWSKLPKTNNQILICSLIMGLLNSVAYLAQTIGLQTISAARSAFITGMSVILVPLLAPFFKVGSLRFIDIFSTLISLLGLYFLTGANLHDISTGDNWTLLCAVAFALQIVYLQQTSKKINDYELLAFYQLLFTVPVALLFAPLTTYPNLFYPNVIIALLFCAIFATTIAYFIQAKYQRYTTPTTVALIFALEPVFATIFGVLINRDGISVHTVIGGLLILLSLVIPTSLSVIKRWLKN